MTGREAYRIALAKEQKKKRKKTTESDEARKLTPRTRWDDSFHSVNHVENNIAMALDHKNELKRYAEILDRLEKTKDVRGFIEDVSPGIAADLLLIATDSQSPPKVRLEAIRDILDRGGYGKVTKHMIAKFDASSSKDEIISTIMGSKKDLKKAGIEIVDDDKDQEK